MNYKSPKILAIIPARKGSKGILNKNIKNIAGKPLIYWTIDAAKKSKYISEICVSTNCTEIAKISSQFGIDVNKLRPNDLAEDETMISDVILHELSFFNKAEIICLLQPTSPLRTYKHIDEAISNFFADNASALVSVMKTKHSPLWSFEVNDKNHINPFFSWEKMNKRRQDLPETYMLNGAIYLAKKDFFKKNKSFFSNNTIVYKMDSNVSIDIDDIDDFILAENKLIRERDNGI